MYEELIERLNAYSAEHEYHGGITAEAADAIEELNKLVDAIPHVCECCIGCEVEAGGCDCFVLSPKRAKEYLSKPRWIPVTERPPLRVGDDGYNGYLVYANGYYEVADYTTAMYKFDNVPCFHVNGEYEPDVTHFMPLPKPPKEET